jgi:hypothetical protein
MRFDPLHARIAGCGAHGVAGRAAQTFKTDARRCVYHPRHLCSVPGYPSMFDTKIAIVLREDLAPWQALNV